MSWMIKKTVCMCACLYGKKSNIIQREREGEREETVLENNIIIIILTTTMKIVAVVKKKNEWEEQKEKEGNEKMSNKSDERPGRVVGQFFLRCR